MSDKIQQAAREMIASLGIDVNDPQQMAELHRQMEAIRPEVEARLAATGAVLLPTREAAKAAGAKRFFTGEPCHRGHVAPRYTNGGDCVECMKENNRRYSKPRAASSPGQQAPRPWEQ